MAGMYDLAQSAFNSFSRKWNYNDYNGTYLWQRADQMHSYLFFCNMADNARASNPAWKVDFWSSLRAQMLVGDEKTNYGNYDLFLRILTHNADGLWADDFGWTGICCVAASQFFDGEIARSRWGPQAAIYSDQYATLAVMSLNIMCSRYFENYGEPIINGISNGPANSPPSAGTWNTVTNANFFGLCMKVSNMLQNYRGADPKKIKAKATSAKFAQLQYIWFTSWIKQQADPPKVPYNYFHILFPNYPLALVEAQPHTDPVSAPNYTYGSTDHPTWYPGTVWTGDQGLFAYAMSAYWANNRDLSDIPTIVSGIVQGSWNAFGNSQRVNWMFRPIGAGDSIIREPPTAAVFSDARDYVVGRGVMCRFFAEPDTQALLASPAGNFSLARYFGYMFQATADAIQIVNGRLNPDLGDEEGMALSIQNFKSVWGQNYNYNDGFWGDISEETVVVCQELILAFDVVGAWLAVQSASGEGKAESEAKVQDGEEIHGENGYNGLHGD